MGITAAPDPRMASLQPDGFGKRDGVFIERMMRKQR
jgi:hypothetical protein